MADTDAQVNIPDSIKYPAQLVEALHADPKLRPKLLALVKEYAPNLRIPEIDTPNEVMSTLKPYLEAMKKDKDDTAKELAEIKAERQREKQISKLGLGEDDLTEIDKLMKDGGVSNFETAAELHRLRSKAAAPRSIVPTPFTIGDDANVTKDYLRDPVGTARKRAYAELAAARR